MPATTLLAIPPEEQAQMRAVLRRMRYGYLLAFHVLLLWAVVERIAAEEHAKNAA